MSVLIIPSSRRPFHQSTTLEPWFTSSSTELATIYRSSSFVHTSDSGYDHPQTLKPYHRLHNSWLPAKTYFSYSIPTAYSVRNRRLILSFFPPAWNPSSVLLVFPTTFHSVFERRNSSRALEQSQQVPSSMCICLASHSPVPPFRRRVWTSAPSPLG